MTRRLDQILSSLGYCSRREAKSFLRHHDVLVNGTPERNPAIKVSPDAVLVDGEPLEHPRGLLILLHKPAGYVCSHDPKEGPSVYSLFPERWLHRNPRIETVGRLDKDTTGVLLLTDDGQLNHRWTSPNHQLEKTYLATVDSPLEEDMIGHFASGRLQLEEDEKPCRPARLEILEPLRARLTLTEGRFHQVKRMFAHFGCHVLTLHREQFGEHRTDDLAPGAWRVLTSASDGGTATSP